MEYFVKIGEYCKTDIVMKKYKDSDISIIDHDFILNTKNGFFAKIVIFEGLLEEKLKYSNRPIEKMKEVHAKIVDINKLLEIIDKCQSKIEKNYTKSKDLAKDPEVLEKHLMVNLIFILNIDYYNI